MISKDSKENKQMILVLLTIFSPRVHHQNVVLCIFYPNFSGFERFAKIFKTLGLLAEKLLRPHNGFN